MSKKALKLEEVDQAVNFNEPLPPDHEFFTNFSDLRGEFEEKIIYKTLNLRLEAGKYKFSPKINSLNKSLLFLGGMRGTGKTTELAKYAQILNHSEAFLCVTCNIDEGLNTADLEYMDILIFQLEQLTKVLDEHNINVDKGIIKKMESWFEQRSNEINRSLKAELGLQIGSKTKKESPLSNILKFFDIGGQGLVTGVLSSLLGIFGELKAGVTGSYERTQKVRQILKNRFNDFAAIFNEYIEEVNVAIRKKGIAQEVLFIIDGLEKTLSTEIRKKVVLEESGFIQKIKAYTVFTLPIELMKERRRLEQFSTVATFPFVKLYEQDGRKIEAAFERLEEFVYKRIESTLFDDPKTVTTAIECSGGSPRELLRILEMTAFNADEKEGIIKKTDLDKALKRLGDQAAQYLTKEDLEVLMTIEEENKKSKPHFFEQGLERLLEQNLVMEYNAGTHKRPNPILKHSRLYQEYRKQGKIIL